MLHRNEILRLFILQYLYVQKFEKKNVVCKTTETDLVKSKSKLFALMPHNSLQ